MALDFSKNGKILSRSLSDSALLTALSNDNWQPSGKDNALLAMVEIIYKDYLLGSGKITGARGGYAYVNSKNVTINVVDALKKLLGGGLGLPSSSQNQLVKVIDRIDSLGVSSAYSDEAKDFSQTITDFLISNDYDKKSIVSPIKILSIIPEELKHYFWKYQYR